jgi:tryptophan-rich sensory protein
MTDARESNTPAASRNYLHNATALVLFLTLTFGVATLGGIATSSSVGTWYQTIEKPAWTPPGGVIGTVWSVLYFLMALAAWLVWLRTGLRGGAKPLGLWIAQLALNLAWSFLFFGLRNPGLALIELVVLWAFIAATTIAFFRARVAAGILLLPYLAWVTFAGFLNATVWRMNAG